MTERRSWLASMLPQSELTTAQQMLLFGLLLLLIFSRRPGDVLHAQFYAEDGKRWFAQAYNWHWLRSLQIPDASYLQVLPRLFAGLALWVPLRWSPLILTIGGASLQALPVLVLLSRRCLPWGTLSERMAMGAFYLANPNIAEIHVNITNAQWHFALLEILLAFGEPPRSRLGQVVDILVFLLGSVSGPFGLVLLPLLLLSWWRRRERWTLMQAACLACGTALQLRTILTGAPFGALPAGAVEFSRADIAAVPLGATPALLVRLLGSEVFLASLIGHLHPEIVPLVIPALFLILGLVMIACGLRWGPRAFRYFALFTVILLAASLKSPVIADSISRWHALSIDGGMRYYFLPTLLFLWSGVYCYQRSGWKPLRVICISGLALFSIGLCRWEYRSFPDHHFAASVAAFNQAAPGQPVVIEIQPTPWTMTLIKH